MLRIGVLLLLLLLLTKMMMMIKAHGFPLNFTPRRGILHVLPRKIVSLNDDDNDDV